MGVRPAVSAEWLVRFELERRFVDSAMALPAFGSLPSIAGAVEEFTTGFDEFVDLTRPVFKRLVFAPDLMGDVPPIFWLDPNLHRLLALMVFNLAFDLADLTPIEDEADPVYAPVDLGEHGALHLRGGRRSKAAELVLYRRSASDTTGLETHHWRTSQMGSTPSDARNAVIRLIEVLVMRCVAPDLPCASVVSFPSDRVEPFAWGRSTKAKPEGAISLNLNPQVIMEATPESLPHDQARAQLESLVALYRRGLAEALPLFRATSASMAFNLGTTLDGTWEGSTWSPGESADLANQLLFPLSAEELKADPAFCHLVQVLRQSAIGVSLTLVSRASRSPSASLQRALDPEITDELKDGVATSKPLVNLEEEGDR